jgi:imidazoleglycerol-phosphate dehydratase/histidinol-phosphatase
MSNKILFIDRDGTIVKEPLEDQQLDLYEKFEFLPGVITYLAKIVEEFNYQLVMVTNQDGLGTDSFPYEDFIGPHELMLKILEGEGIQFQEILIDDSFGHKPSPNRKPALGLVQHYLNPAFDLEHSFVIGDRMTDMQFAKHLGCQGVLIHEGIPKSSSDPSFVQVKDWAAIYEYLWQKERSAIIQRVTRETTVELSLVLDGKGRGNIDTGLTFFDHMLEQLVKHAALDLELRCKGDLEVDEHHTIEDVALSLGAAFAEAFQNKRGIQRYGFMLPMDDALTSVAIDIGGRPWLQWALSFEREYIGDFPTEMAYHFFKSLADEAKWNISIKAAGANEHHKIESVFKAFARSIAMAKKQERGQGLPTTKGVL